MCSALCQSGIFQICSHMHLNVGHTHEDIDGCLSLVTTALGAATTLETPADVARVIQAKLEPLFARHRMEFGIEMVDCADGQQINERKC